MRYENEGGAVAESIRAARDFDALLGERRAATRKQRCDAEGEKNEREKEREEEPEVGASRGGIITIS